MNANDWIKVEDCLPQEGQYVLAYGGRYLDSIRCRVRVARFQDKLFVFPLSDRSSMDPTHWQPLAVPPQESEEEKAWKVWWNTQEICPNGDGSERYVARAAGGSYYLVGETSSHTIWHAAWTAAKGGQS